MFGEFYQLGLKLAKKGAIIPMIIQNNDANIANNERIRAKLIIVKLPFIRFPILYAMNAITNPGNRHKNARPPNNW